MEVVTIVVHQVTIMFLLIAVGIILLKKNIVTLAATRAFCNVLLIIVVPSMMINSYHQPFSAEKTFGLLIAFILAVAVHFLAVAISRLLIRKDEANRYRIERLGAVYSNCGFMGFPVLAALLGTEGVFYGTAFNAVFNIFIWIEGIGTLQDGKKLGLKKSILNPGCIAVMIGLIIYFTQIPIPKQITETVAYLGSMNAPLAMLVTGMFLASVSPREIIKDWRTMKVAFLRTLFIPLLFLGCLTLLGVSGWFPGSEKACIAIAVSASCPAAASIILIPASLGMDGSQGAKILAFSTLLSIITLPLMSFLAFTFFKI